MHEGCFDRLIQENLEVYFMKYFATKPSLQHVCTYMCTNPILQSLQHTN